MKAKKTILNSVIGVFIMFLLFSIVGIIILSVNNTKDKMYEQMTIQGKQLGNQIKANIEMDESIINSKELTQNSIDNKIKNILLQLGKDTHIIYIGILNNSSVVVAHSDLKRVGIQYKGAADNTTIQGGNDVINMYYDAEKKVNALNLGLPIRNGNNEILGVLSLGFSIESVDSAIKSIIIQSITMGIVVFALAVIILTFFIRKLIKPIITLSNMAEVSSNGDFTKQIEVKTNNEIGVLSKAFNKLISEIKNIIYNLTEYTNNLNNTGFMSISWTQFFSFFTNIFSQIL